MSNTLSQFDTEHSEASSVNHNPFRLDGKRVLVTGAGRGIGLGIAQACAQAGAEVFLCARTSSEVEKAAADISRQGGKAKYLELDITDIESFESTVNELPGLDVFINSAGTNRPMPLSEVTEGDYHAIMDLNVKAAIFSARAVANRLIADGNSGSIINISSQMGHVGAKNRTLYCASKWALEGFTKALATELGPKNIRVNTICPTFIETPLTKPFFEDKEFQSEVLSKIKLGRIGQVNDVAGAAVFLASDASALMTGSSLMLDGGWTAD
ncbi:SDR family NAD(P)-dependent oxidoreductase [Vibrio mediterranei]|uniref:SDR family NAD(P)-dependent oxidoreductase n=1 Tax=Vibrio mediterranei TaxID=689 RepID=UPI00148E75F3|nr:SDR family oxidoreductase [Vibrio mediterranei]NOI23814.1 SDR family oxidoreductase [Vibrio mediterranei]